MDEIFLKWVKSNIATESNRIEQHEALLKQLKGELVGKKEKELIRELEQLSEWEAVAAPSTHTLESCQSEVIRHQARLEAFKEVLEQLEIASSLAEKKKVKSQRNI